MHYSTADVIRGKFSYMPKEQATGRDIDQRIDIFGAGVTLYEALTGVKPYTSNTLAEQIYQLDQPVPPPSALVAELPEEVDHICLRAMAPEPDMRYATAQQFASDLQRALGIGAAQPLGRHQAVEAVGQLPRRGVLPGLQHRRLGAPLVGRVHDDQHVAVDGSPQPVGQLADVGVEPGARVPVRVGRPEQVRVTHEVAVGARAEQLEVVRPAGEGVGVAPALLLARPDGSGEEQAAKEPAK